mmetsp:Transcript_163829/g.525450  ORF Transcript_163829/g.525450 Transcript_163829/m.525450 type:complete len:606 (-) Transcript_163829:453-2270(-)
MHGAIGGGDEDLLREARQRELGRVCGRLSARHVHLACRKPGGGLREKVQEGDAVVAVVDHGGPELARGVPANDGRGEARGQGRRHSGADAGPGPVGRQTCAFGNGAARQGQHEACVVPSGTKDLTLQALEDEFRNTCMGNTDEAEECAAARDAVQSQDLVAARSQQRRREARGPADLSALQLRRDGLDVALVLGIERLHERCQGGDELLRRGRHVAGGETTVATAGVASLLPGALAGPGCHPGLHVRRPALNAALLFQQVALAVHLLEAAAAHDEDPHAAGRDEGATEELPREHRRLDLPGPLLGHLVALLTLGGLHLLQQASLAGLQPLGGGDEVHGVPEGRGQRPLRGRPGLARHLRPLLLELGRCEIEHAQRPEEVDDVAEPAQGVDAAHPEGVGVQNAVVDGHARDSQKGDEGHDLLHRWHPASLLRCHDVQLEDVVLCGREHGDNRPCGPEAAQLTEDVAHRVETDGREPVGEEEKDADAGVDVVAPPLLLQAAVQLEVLGVRSRRGRGAALVLAELGDLVVVPPGHPPFAGLHPLAALGILNGVLGRGRDEGDAEDVEDALLLELVAGHPRLVQHLRRRDGQTHIAGEHVGGAGVGTST